MREGFSRCALLSAQPLPGSIVLQVALCSDEKVQKKNKANEYAELVYCPTQLKILNNTAGKFANADHFLKERNEQVQHFLPGTARVCKGMRRRRATTKNILLEVNEEQMPIWPFYASCPL